MQGSFNVWTDHKKGHAKVKDLARFKPMQRHLFLHEKALLFCKKREESGEGYDKAPSYSYKQSLHVSTVQPSWNKPFELLILGHSRYEAFSCSNFYNWMYTVLSDMLSEECEEKLFRWLNECSTDKIQPSSSK